MDNSVEQWRVVAADPMYEVSNHGRVRSMKTARVVNGVLTPRVLKPVLTGPPGKQYLAVGLTLGKRERVHRLVLAAFVGPCPDGMEGCHRNGDKLDNTLSNLRWDTPGNNNRDKRTHGTDHQVRKTHCPRGHEYTPANCYDPTMQARRCKQCARDRAQNQKAPKKPRSHCQRGHEFTPANTITSGNARKCRACENARQRRKKRVS